MSRRFSWRDRARALLSAGACLASWALPQLAPGADLSTPDFLLEKLQGAPLHPSAQKQCTKRVGPLDAQATAWQRWRDSQNRGHAVSQGIFPCHVHRGSRGYCYNVFTRC